MKRIVLSILSTLILVMMLLPDIAIAIPDNGNDGFCTTTGNYTICTDQEDYAPGDTVQISGNGFAANAELTVKVTRPDGSVVSGDGSFVDWPTPYDSVTTNKKGNFDFDYVLDGIEGEYLIEVLEGNWYGDLDTVLATHTFTDAATIQSVTVDGGSSVTVSPGETITVELTVQLTYGSDWRSTSWAIATSPPDNWEYECENTPDYSTNGTHTASFDVTAPTTAETYNLYIRAYEQNDCQSGGGHHGGGGYTSYTLTGAVIVESGPTISVTIDQASGQDDPTDASPINFTVVFSESVSDFDSGDVNLSGTAGADTAVVSGSGDTYNVAVSGMTDEGTVIASIPAGVATGYSSGYGNAASTSTDNQVTYEELPVENPELTETCGLDIVLVLDVSSSVSGNLQDIKDAATGFVDAFLPATPSLISVVSFSADANLVHDWSSDADSINTAIEDLNYSMGTNWQQGLLYAQTQFGSDRDDHPDLVIFISDGNPTRYGDPAQTDYYGTIALEYAIEVADDIKTAGIRIITIGIGSSIDADNLIAISSSDAYYSSNFDQLADDLKAIASELCGGTITVHKVLDADGDLGTTDDQTDGESWTFTATVASPGSSTPDSGDTGSDGLINFDIDLGGESTATVDITEALQNGYPLIDATCSGATTDGTFDGTDSVTGIVVGADDIVSVYFYNQPPADCNTAYLDCHTIEFVSHTFDGTYSTWTYDVSSNCAPAISHWIIDWCNCDAIESTSESSECGYDPTTGLTGIKFGTGYNDVETRTVSFTLLGDYEEGCIDVAIKTGTDEYYDDITGPICEVCTDEVCDDGIDNDCDGLIDCNDPDCPCTDCYECDTETGVCEPICAGGDEECGCEECLNCNEQDGWYNSGDSYVVQEGTEYCTYQPQQYRDYYCSNNECLYNVTEERDLPMGCTTCGECTELESVTIVSDTTTQIEGGGNAVTPYQKPYPQDWDSRIDYSFSEEAGWIWESYYVDEPIDGDVVTFLKDFALPDDLVAGSIEAYIYVTCDNGYEVWVNGSVVGSAQLDGDWQTYHTEDYVHTSGWMSVEAWDISSLLTAGTNSLLIYGANEYMGPADGQSYGTEESNPAGLIFEIQISYCVPVEDGTDCSTEDYYDDWEYYCNESGQVWKHQLFHDFYCEDGECTDHTEYVNEEMVEDCDAQDGEYLVGSTYDCCDPQTGDACTCQNYETRDYSCVIDPDTGLGSCTYEVTSTRTGTSACEDCDDLDYYGEYEFYCDGDSVYKHRRFYDYECVGGTCTLYDDSYTDNTFVENCNDGDGWYNVGDPYACCDADGWACTCQDQIYRDYYCDDATGQCTYSEGDTQTLTDQCTDCDAQDNWYDTGATQWVDDSACTEKEQKEQEERDYYCSGGACTYDLTGQTQWVDTGNTRNKPDETACGEDYTEETWVYYCLEGELWRHQQHHDFYCEDGECTDHTSWTNEELVEDCDSLDNWYDTETPSYACCDEEGWACTCQEQEYRDYYCDAENETCSYNVTGDPRIDHRDCVECDECYECVDGVCEFVVTADAGPDYSITSGASIGIGGDPTGSGTYPEFTYSWAPTAGLDDSTSPNPTASPTSTTTYTVTVTDSQGCSATDSMTVTVGGGGGGGGGGGFSDIEDECYLIIDMMGERTLVEIDCCDNTTLEQGEAYTEDLLHLLELQEDTLVLCGDCDGCNCYPEIIVMSPSEEEIEPPEGMAIVGPIYDFTGYQDVTKKFACSLVTYFNPTASVLLHYDPELLNDNATNPVIAFFSHTQNAWVILDPDPGVVAEVGVATGLADYFASPFAVLVTVEPEEIIDEPEPEPEPASFVASNLNITPAEVKSGETVDISLNVANDGEESGSYTVVLKIDGQTIESQVITLDGGQSQTVSFTVAEKKSGQYEVSVADLSGEFTVKASYWWIWLIVAAVIILGILGWRYREKLGFKKT